MRGQETEEIKIQANPIRDSIQDLLQSMEIREEDFRSPRGRRGGIAHQKVVDKILHAWQETRGFGKAKHSFVVKSEELGIDFVGKDWGAGRILLGVEVDTGHQATGSWQKLSDIRTENKVWVYLTKDENMAEQNFAESVRLIKVLLKERGETKASFGELLAVLKPPHKFKVEVISPAE